MTINTPSSVIEKKTLNPNQELPLPLSPSSRPFLTRLFGKQHNPDTSSSPNGNTENNQPPDYEKIAADFSAEFIEPKDSQQAPLDQVNLYRRLERNIENNKSKARKIITSNLQDINPDPENPERQYCIKAKPFEGGMGTVFKAEVKETEYYSASDLQVCRCFFEVESQKRAKNNYYILKSSLEGLDNKFYKIISRNGEINPDLSLNPQDIQYCHSLKALLPELKNLSNLKSQPEELKLLRFIRNFIDKQPNLGAKEAAEAWNKQSKKKLSIAETNRALKDCYKLDYIDWGFSNSNIIQKIQNFIELAECLQKNPAQRTEEDCNNIKNYCKNNRPYWGATTISLNLAFSNLRKDERKILPSENSPLTNFNRHQKLPLYPNLEDYELGSKHKIYALKPIYIPRQVKITNEAKSWKSSSLLLPVNLEQYLKTSEYPDSCFQGQAIKIELRDFFKPDKVKTQIAQPVKTVLYKIQGEEVDRALTDQTLRDQLKQENQANTEDRELINQEQKKTEEQFKDQLQKFIKISTEQINSKKNLSTDESDAY